MGPRLPDDGHLQLDAAEPDQSREIRGKREGSPREIRGSGRIQDEVIKQLRIDSWASRFLNTVVPVLVRRRVCSTNNAIIMPLTHPGRGFRPELSCVHRGNGGAENTDEIRRHSGWKRCWHKLIVNVTNRNRV